ncbi:MAG: hypothetical protein JRE40_02010 [Deltaproteobacteria bacterium]|nr:hypothetical protein [Deltaproteobacteria bacterium]MBW2672526.1 hypothetical protein [Deltaproteobacteria bacterium]
MIIAASPIRYTEPAIDKPMMQIGLAMANFIPATLLFRESRGEKPIYAFAAGTLLIFGSYHIFKAIALHRGEIA